MVGVVVAGSGDHTAFPGMLQAAAGAAADAAGGAAIHPAGAN